MIYSLFVCHVFLLILVPKYYLYYNVSSLYCLHVG